MTINKHKIDWAIVATITRPNGTWFDKTLTDFPETIGIDVNEWLSQMLEEEYDNKTIISKTHK